MKGVPAAILYLDFGKAFDKVLHSRLIEKREANGIGGKISKWIKCWLTDKESQLTMQPSDWLPVLS